MEAGENYFRAANCRAIDLRIISPRRPLPGFYAHLGYLETGTASFAPDVPVKVPCHYILMSKPLECPMTRVRPRAFSACMFVFGREFASYRSPPNRIRKPPSR